MSETFKLAVNGTLMKGLDLHSNLEEAGARFLEETHTQATYRLWSIDDRHPAMMRTASGGTAVAVEVYEITAEGLASVLVKEPPGLCVGKVKLASGEEVLGVVGEAVLCDSGKEITRFGGWRSYLKHLHS